VTGDEFGSFDFGLAAEDEARARALHESAIVVDMLCQGPCGHRAFRPEWDDEIRAYLATGGNVADGWNYVSELPIRHALAGTDGGVLEECWRSSGVTAGTRERDFVSVRDILGSLAIANAQFEQLPWFRRALSGEDIQAAKRDGQVAGFVNSQDTVGFGTDLTLLEDARALGLCMLQLTYNSQNFVGTGCTERIDSGLSNFGVRLVERSNDLGVLVDTSHCGRQTTLDACNVSRRPVVASHTSAASLYEVDRAKSDEELKAIAATGGVVGVYAVPFFLGAGKHVTVAALLDHVDYFVQLVGWEHVGIGTDWPLQMSQWALEHVAQPWTQVFGFRPEHNVDSMQTLVGFDDYRDYPNITRGLVARGYPDEQIRGILGENFCRVFDEVAA
jgi:membrane dipeptidase